jgi:methionyl aminopeptidase
MIIKTEDIPKLKRSAQILASMMFHLKSLVKAGVSCGDLNDFAEKFITSYGAKPSFKGLYGYPYTLITEINDEVVHGMSPKSKIIPENCVISLDCGAIWEGLYSDMCILLTIGNVSAEIQKLVQKTEESLWAGINQVKPGKTVGDIGFAVDKVLKDAGLGNVLDLGGHGIGYKPHSEPHITHAGRIGKGAKLFENQCICIEPMVTLGSGRVKFVSETNQDGTFEVVKSWEGCPAAHIEHQLLITKKGAEIITKIAENEVLPII